MICSQTLIDLLRRNSELNNRGITYIEGDDNEIYCSYRDIFEEALKYLHYFQAGGMKPGDELIFQLDDNRTFIFVFWACIMGGFIPVPITVGNNEEHRMKLFTIWKTLNHPYLIANKAVIDHLVKYAANKELDLVMEEMIDRCWVADEIKLTGESGDIFEAGYKDLALIQFSSGSTGSPKGVMLTHENLVTNTYGIIAGGQLTDEDRYLSWMPLTHDMGLIAYHLTSVACNMNQFLMPTALFIRRPSLWIKKTSEHRATIIASPNFGYKFLLTYHKAKNTDDWDLSSVRLIFNGAEPISTEICEMFLDRMSKYGLRRTAMFTVYGLAEASVAVAFPPAEKLYTSLNVNRRHLGIGEKIVEVESTHPDSCSFVEVGTAIPGCELRICDEQDQIVSDRTVGFIQIRGTNVTAGYYNNPEATNKALTADGWIQTGDLGFIRDGQLIITGRFKDIIFINGQNVYPHDIERVAEELEGVELGKVAASGVRCVDTGTEKIIVFIASRQTAEQFVPLAVGIKKHLSERGGWEISDVLPVKKIPKTTSGKVQRYVLSEQYERGEYAELSSTLAELSKEYIIQSKKGMPHSEMEQRILGICKEVLQSDLFDAHDRFMEVGLNSLQMEQIAGRIETELAKKINVADLFSYPTVSKLAEHLLKPAEQSTMRKEVKQRQRDVIRDIAIIGMHGVFPQADNPEEFWERLITGQDCVGAYAQERVADAEYFVQALNMSGRDKRFVEGGYLDEVDKFDYSFFKLTPKEASLMDPNQRLFLQTAWHTIEHAGYNGEQMKGRKVGVYVGYSKSGYEYDRLLSEFMPEELPNYALGNLPSIIASRISYLLDLRGPAVTVDTACSSSLVAVHMACKAIRNGECEMALAGGVKTILLPVRTGIGMESSDGKAKVFDDASDGTGWGEGVAAVLLKPLEQAVADGDHIMAVIKGSAVNQDGSTAGISAPSAAAQTELLLDAWNDAGIDPTTITYLESHGTGTKLGDPIEIEGIKQAFATVTSRKQFCAVGSVKANIGHLYEAAGIAGLVKSVLALQHKQIPPLLHFQTPNRNISFEDSPVYVNRRVIDWEQGDTPRRCGVSSFGFSGTNCHIVMEEYSALSNIVQYHQVHILTLSAKSEAALRRLTESYIALLNNTVEDHLQSVCYTANIGRAHHRYRIAIVASDRQDAMRKLRLVFSTEMSQAPGVFYSLVDNRKTIAVSANASDVLNAGNGNLLQQFEASGCSDLTCAYELANNYVSGADIDWGILYSRHKHNRLPLPVYPFERKRCWLPGITATDLNQEKGGRNMEVTATELADVQSANHNYDHKQELIQTLKGLIGKITHYEPDEIDPRTHFLELGFDSIVLMQLKNAIKDSMAVELPVQELFDSINTVEALGDYLAQVVPRRIDNIEPISVSPVVKEASLPLIEQNLIPVPEASNTGTYVQDSGRGGEVVGSSLTAERIVEQQLQLMSQQLEFMRHYRSPQAAVKVSESPRATQAQVGSVSRSESEVIARAIEEAAPAVDTIERPLRKSGGSDEGETPFVPYKQNQVQLRQVMSDKQEQHLKQLIESYATRTQGTKELTQQYRHVYANNRNVAGFRPHLKEMVYQTIAVKADGSKLWDVDGNEYVDLTMGFGVNFFGHNPDFIRESIERELANGMPLGPMSDKAGLLAERIRQLTGVERVAYYNSGTEAVMVALRLARAATGRDKIVLFSGSYHGTFDGVLALGGISDHSTPLAPGILQHMVDDVVVLNYGTDEALEYISGHADQLAAVLVEPVQSRRPDYRPQAFLRKLRQLTQEAGTALIFDEVITGFRMHPGGAQAMFGIQADLVTYGKVVGGGMPIGIVAGNARFMDGIDGGMWQFGDNSYPQNEARRTFVAGTFCHHPLAMAAALTVVDKLTEEGEALQHNLNNRTARMAGRLNEWFAQERVPMKVVHCGSLFRFVLKGDLELFFYHMLNNGVYIWEGRNCFLSTVHTDDDIEAIVSAVQQSVSELKRGGFIPEPPDGGSGLAVPDKEETAIVMTRDQQQLWLASKLSPATSLAFQESVVLRLTGSLHVDSFVEAIQQVAERHEALRIRVADDGEKQYVQPGIIVAMPMTDWSGRQDIKPTEAQQQWIDTAINVPFDLTTPDPLFRVQLLRYEQDKYTAVFTFHHLIADGWSIGLFFQELASIYSSLISDKPAVLMQQVQFGEYVRRQTESNGNPQRAEAIRMWQERLGEKWSSPRLSAGGDSLSIRGSRETVLLERHVVDKWKQLSITHGSSLFTTLLTCFQIVLHRHTGQRALAVGVPFAGQASMEALCMIGNCVHMFPVCTDAGGQPSFVSMLQQVKQWWAAIEQYQSYPLTELAQELYQSGIELPPLNVVFNMDRVPGSLRFAGMESELQAGGVQYAKYELFLNVTEIEGRLRLDFDYNMDALEREVIQRLSNELTGLLEICLEHPDAPFELGDVIEEPHFSETPISSPNNNGKPVVKSELMADERVKAIWQTVLGEKEIGLDDSFFDIGGTSMKAMLMIAKLNQEFNTHIRINDLFNCRTIRQLLPFVTADSLTGSSMSASSRLEPIAQQAMYPVSSAQKRMFIMDQVSHSTAYNISGMLRLDGALDGNRLIECLQSIVQRHEALRTSFILDNGELYQIVHPNIQLPVLQRTVVEQELDEIAHQFVQPFSLETAPLIRAELLHMSADKHVLLVDIPHIVADGLSLAIILEELFSLYNGQSLPELRVHYKDYVSWLSKAEVQKKLEEGKAYWLQQFAEEAPTLELPTDRPRPMHQSFDGHTIEISLSKEATQEVQALSSQTGTTLFMILLAAYQTLLHKYTGQEVIVVGTPVLGRNHADCEKMVGMFVNTLPLKQRIDSNLTFRELLQEVKETALAAYEHQDYPFEQLLGELQLVRDMSRNPLFDTSFAWLEAGIEPFVHQGMSWTPIEYNAGTSKFDLTVNAMLMSDEITLQFEYSTALFDEETIVRMADHLANIINNVGQNADQRLSELSIMGDEERNKLLHIFNDTDMNYDRLLTLQQLFEEQVERSPDATAVVADDRSLTYAELNTRANQLAAKLRQQGIGADSIVGLMLDRTVEMMVGIWAVLKAGGAYLPIDPDYPSARIHYMMEDSGSQWLLTEKSMMESIPFEGKVICIDDESHYDGDGHNLPPINEAHHLAYVIYTSGSTGNPKGVMLEHQSVHNFFVGMRQRIPFHEGQRILALTTISFDIFVLEALLPLTVGMEVVFAPRQAQQDPQAIWHLVKRHKIGMLQATPSRLLLLLNDSSSKTGLRGLDSLIVGGEALNREIVIELERYKNLQLFNVYGPTETTVWSTIGQPKSDRVIDIGTPIANTQIYILDSADQPQPIGIAGELCIAGDGLARMYHGQPEMTASKFISNPYRSGTRMYRTGDLAKWRPDGTIFFIGRKDTQVKIRGYRIETGEIESLLLQHERIVEAVVVAKQIEGQQTSSLCAYVSTDSSYTLTVAELREYLSEQLPSYMLPSYFVFLDKMPQTPNGKIDRKVLPDPELHGDFGDANIPPRNEKEAAIARAWEIGLGVERIGIRDDFFVLGGDSIKALKVVSLLKDNHYKTEISSLLNYTTIEQLSPYVAAANSASETAAANDSGAGGDGMSSEEWNELNQFYNGI
ncbi:non-ribosomal peptide synthetase [Paenibacillus fonticola]|uniref:non-ribosomal peptide synthetase n=1 Tax=Paenibacillus fonticola TaxID=379896 RepID=UPI000362F159|nr:non-ribosomal peptide synthetase [Paenibacillus fonticola]